MGSERSDDDTWDIASSVGATAVMVAAARAGETERDDALIRDPFAKNPGGRRRNRCVGDDPRRRLQQQDGGADPEVAAVLEHMGNYQAVRTHFFDAYFAEAAAAGIRQVVILASGAGFARLPIDRAGRHDGLEIDQPKVLEYKDDFRAHGATPAAALHRRSTCEWTGRKRCGKRDSTIRHRPPGWLKGC